MRTKPMIGLNADYRAAKKDAPAFSFLASGYYDAITAVGGIPVVIPPLAEEADLKRVLDMLDGVVHGRRRRSRSAPRRIHAPSDRPADGNSPRGFRSHVDAPGRPIAACRCSASAPACNC